MAGGMTGRRGIPLSERVRRTPGAAGAAGVPPDPVPDDGPARHCWVTGGVADRGVKRPGLLVEWREGPAGWEGRVVYVATLRPGRWSLVEEWLPADQLAPR